MLKKIITVIDASNAPTSPDLPLTTLIVIIKNIATTEDVSIEPCQREVLPEKFLLIKHRLFGYLF
jgi:uncharacterized protein YejL (UPF0352 family)